MMTMAVALISVDSTSNHHAAAVYPPPRRVVVAAVLLGALLPVPARCASVLVSVETMMIL